MAEQATEVTEALAKIKSAVDEKFESVAIAEDVKGDIKAATETKADKESVEELKGAIEALEAKFDAIPAPAVFKKEKEQNMNINEAFVKAFEEKGEHKFDLELKSITESANITGAPENTFGLSGNRFAANPVRGLARKLQITGSSAKLPRIAGAHGAMIANAASKESALTGNATVTEVVIALETIRSLGEVTKEAESDIIGFDQYWGQHMLNDLAAKEATQHVAVVEAIAGETAASATALTLDDLSELVFAVQPQYRAGGVMVVSTDAMKQIRTLNASGTGSDLVFDAQLGQFRLFGYPVVENGYMANVAASNVVAAFGDWMEGVTLVEKGAASLARYDQTKPGYWTYSAEMRSKLAEVNADAVKTLTMAAA